MRRQLLLLGLLLFVILDLHLLLWNGHHGRPLSVVPLIDVHDRPETAVEDEPSSFGDGIRAALADRRYGDLEVLAAELRDPNRRFRGGTAQITRFYGIVAEVKRLPTDESCRCRPVDPAAFAAKQAQLEAWHAATPEQPTSAIALAKLWDDAGWAARGEEWARDVVPEQWITMRQDIAQAWEHLKDVDLDQDPVAHYVMIDITRARSDRAAQDAAYAKAVETFPTYYDYYAQYADMLQQKWFGAPGELDDYLGRLTAPERGVDGQIAYAFAAYRLRYDYRQPDRVDSDALHFRPIVTAYQARERVFGLRPHDWKMLFYFSLHSGMTVSAIQAYQRMGTDWDSAIWWTREGFDSDVAWYKAHIESLVWAE